MRPAFDAAAALKIRRNADMVDADQIHRMVDMVGQRRDCRTGPFDVEGGNAFGEFALRLLARAEEGVKRCQTERSSQFAPRRDLFLRHLVQIGIEGDDLDDAAFCGQRLQFLIRHVARMGGQRMNRRMRGDDRRARQFDRLKRGGLRGVADIDHQAEIIGAGDHGAAERRQAAMFAAFRVGAVAELLLRQGAVGDIVVAVVNEAEIARAQTVIDIEQFGRTAGDIGILDADQCDALALAMETANVGRGAGEADFIRIQIIRHTANGGEFCKGLGGGPCMTRIVARALPRIDDEEDRVEPAFAHARQIDLHRVCARLAGIIDFGREGRGDIDMCVDGNDACMDARRRFRQRRRRCLGDEDRAQRPDGADDQRQGGGQNAVSHPFHLHLARHFQASPFKRRGAPRSRPRQGLPDWRCRNGRSPGCQSAR